MFGSDIKEQVINLHNENEVNQVKNFLANHDLQFEQDIEYCITYIDPKSKSIIGTGSFSGKVLKCLAVDEQYQGQNILGKIMTSLMREQYSRGNNHLFLFTPPKNISFFRQMNFHKLAAVNNKIVLMENTPNGIKDYQEKLYEGKLPSKNTAAIVVNCNPFTLGHRYLIEQAAGENDVLYVFVVKEDRSSFPFEIRYNLVVEGTKDLDNVVVFKGEDYIISNATFPSYFLKDCQDIVKTHAHLDLEIFSTYIVPVLNIKTRYVGKEPYCQVTNTYNKLMEETLPQKGIKVTELQRYDIDGQPISASEVRKLIKQGKLAETKPLLPKTTYEFLVSDQARPIIDNIQRSETSRH